MYGERVSTSEPEDAPVECHEDLDKHDLLALLIHQDSIMWTRAHTMLIAQVAFLCAAFLLSRNWWLSSGIVFAGVVVAFLLYSLVKRDQSLIFQLQAAIADERILPKMARWGPRSSRNVLTWLFVGQISLYVLFEVALYMGEI